MRTRGFVKFWFLVALMAPALLSPQAAGRNFEPHEVVVSKELLITDPKVVDSTLADFPGPLSFGHLITQMAGDANPTDFLIEWFRLWEEDQDVNGNTVAGRPAIREKLIAPWQKNDGYDEESGTPWNADFRNAPFRLLAIVNRLDLQKQEAVIDENDGAPKFTGRYGGADADLKIDRLSPGEVRLVFGVLDGNGSPLAGEFTVIFEYALPKDIEGDIEVMHYARDWHALGLHNDFDAEYLDALAKLTRQSTDRTEVDNIQHLSGSISRGVPIAGMPLIDPLPDGAPRLKRVRSNDGALGDSREFRQFVLDGEWRLIPALLDRTPAPAYFEPASHENSVLANFVDANAEHVKFLHLSNSDEIASGVLRFGHLLAGNAFIHNGDGSTCWTSEKKVDPEARRVFSLNTCTGCHAGETNTPSCVHIRPRQRGEESELSAFLKAPGVRKIKDPADPSRTVEQSEMGERIKIFSSLLTCNCSGRSSTKNPGFLLD